MIFTEYSPDLHSQTAGVADSNVGCGTNPNSIAEMLYGKPRDRTVVGCDIIVVLQTASGNVRIAGAQLLFDFLEARVRFHGRFGFGFDQHLMNRAAERRLGGGELRGVERDGRLMFRSDHSRNRN